MSVRNLVIKGSIGTTDYTKTVCLAREIRG